MDVLRSRKTEMKLKDETGKGGIHNGTRGFCFVLLLVCVGGGPDKVYGFVPVHTCSVTFHDAI